MLFNRLFCLDYPVFESFMGSNRFCSSFLPNGCKDIHFGALNYLAHYDSVVNLMLVMLRVISDDNDSDDATSDSVGNDFADWSNGP